MHPMFKSLTGMTIILSSILISAILFAETATQPGPLKAQQVKEMACTKAVEELKIRVSLTRQLGNSFLQLSDEHTNSLSLWSRRLDEQTDLKQSKEYSIFLEKNAKALMAGKPQSEKAIETLNRDLELLTERIASCVN